MKFLNDFKNFFAILGVVSIIFWTCSAESTSDNSSNTNNPPAMTGGTYQVAAFGGLNGGQIVVLNTETGAMKTYVQGSNQQGFNPWEEVPATATTFTH